MRRTLAAVSLTAVTLLGTAACGDDPPDVSGDSNTSDSQQPFPEEIEGDVSEDGAGG